MAYSIAHGPALELERGVIMVILSQNIREIHIVEVLGQIYVLQIRIHIRMTGTTSFPLETKNTPPKYNLLISAKYSALEKILACFEYSLTLKWPFSSECRTP